jgi:hypothetical protein
VGVGETPPGGGGAGEVAGHSLQIESAEYLATVAGANGAVKPAGSAASQLRSAAARPARGASGDHGS